MKSQSQHHKSAFGTFLYSVNPEDFVPARLTAKALNDDSCWEENESDCEDSLPGYMLSNIDDGDY